MAGSRDCERTDINAERRCKSVSSRIAGCSTIRCRLDIPSGPSGCRRSCDISSARAIWRSGQDCSVREATPMELERVHTAEYLRRVAEVESAGGGMLDPDTWVSPGSNLAARLAAGAGIEAVSFVLEAPERRALCLVRPPGHHAVAERRDGLLHLRQRRGGRRGSPRSTRVEPGFDRGLRRSSRQWNSGGLLRLGAGRVSLDSPLPVLSRDRCARRDRHRAGSGPYGRIFRCLTGHRASEYHAAFRSGLEKLADRIRPELVLISAGFDAHAEDPVGDLGLEIEDFEILTREIVAVAETHAQGPNRERARGGLQRPDPGGRGRRPSRCAWAAVDRAKSSEPYDDPDGI